MANFYGDLANQVASDDDSQISDVDPAELAKMVEDVDDLDADLFGSSLGKKRTPVTKTSVKSALKTSAHEEEAERSQKSHVTFDFPEKSSSFQKSDTKKSVKKNVDFGDFDADDPLGDLLSDEDDDFSNKKKKADIFKSDVTESPAKQDVKLSEPEPKNKQNKAKVIAELFGLEEEKKQQPTRDKESSSGWLGLQDPQSTEKKVPEVTKPINRTPEHVEEVKLPKKSPVPRQRSGRSGGGDDDDGGDLLAGMGFDREKRSNTGNQPKSKLDELLGKSSSNTEDTTSRSMLDDLLGKKPSGRERMAGSDGKRNMPEQSQVQQPASGVSFGSYSPSVSVPSRRQSSRRNSGGTAALPDPLGIFSPSPSPKKENPGRQSSYSNPGHKTADWLGISDTSASSPAAAPAPASFVESPERRQRMAVGEQSLPDWLGGGAKTVAEPPPRPLPTQPAPAATLPQTPTAQLSVPQPLTSQGSGVGVLTAGSQMDQQVMSALQHQEMQLSTALHLKQHEERLSALQVRQQEMLQRQEQQLEELIRRQMERQEQLDKHMRSQQERIRAHIQLLLSQPVTNPIVSNTTVAPSVSQPMVHFPPDQKVDDKEGMKEQMQTEKKQLESTLENLKAKHLEELQLLEDSYKRQIAILESSSERQEERLRAENDRLEKEYQLRIARIQEEQANFVEQQQLRLAALQKEHAQEVQQLRELHRQNLEEAHRQHSEMLEHLNRARAMESEALKEASSYSRSLHTALEQLGRNSQEISGLQTELSSQHHSQLDTREAALQAREAELKVTRENLEKQRSVSEEERKRLVGLVAQLEQQLAEQRQNTEEDRWTLRQESARLEAATKALEKERERAMQQIDRERQQLQSQKESMLSEQQILSQQLQQEKMSLASEKSRLETLARLNGTASPDIAKLRAELEAGLRVAQEANQQAEVEREKLRNQKLHFDEEKRRLEDYERDLTSRARELETLTKMAVATKEEGRRALEEARRMEQQRSCQVADIQKQLAELREREKRLAQEKVILSQERLAVQSQKDRELCIQCRRPVAFTFSPPPTPPNLDRRFVDPKLIIMKLSAEDEASRLEQNSHFLSSRVSASK